MAELRKFIHDATRDGTSADEVERGLLRRLLSLGTTCWAIVSHGNGLPIRHAADTRPIPEHEYRPGPKPDRKRMAVVGAEYSVDRFFRPPDQVLEALLRDSDAPPSPDAQQRPRPQHKWTYARRNDDPQQTEAVNGQAATFGWLDEQVRARLVRRRKHVLAFCLINGQEALWSRKAHTQSDLVTEDILDLLHVTPRLWTAAKLFHPQGDPIASGVIEGACRHVVKDRH